MKLQRDAELDKLVDEAHDKLGDLVEISDQAVMTGKDADSLEGAEAGFWLAGEAKGKPVFVSSSDYRDVAYFFIGELKDIKAKIKKALTEN